MGTRVQSAQWNVLDVGPAPADHPEAVGQFRALHPLGWWLSGFIGERDGVPVILNIALDPVPGPWGELTHGGPTRPDDVVTGQLLHSIPMGRLIEQIVSRVAKDQRERSRVLAKPLPAVAHSDDSDRREAVQGPQSPVDLLRRAQPAIRAATARDHATFDSFPTALPKRGRPGRSDAEYRRLANALLDLQDEEGARGIVSRLAKKEGVELETMRTRIKNAVKGGYLIGRGSGSQAYLVGPALTEQPQQQKEES